MQDASTGPPIPARRIFDWLVAFAFAAALLAPSLDGMLRSDDLRGPAPELRAAAAKPASPQSAAEWLEWPLRYEAWWNDCFGLRDVLLRWHSIVRVFGFHVSPDEKHVLGRD